MFKQLASKLSSISSTTAPKLTSTSTSASTSASTLTLLTCKNFNSRAHLASRAAAGNTGSINQHSIKLATLGARKQLSSSSSSAAAAAAAADDSTQQAAQKLVLNFTMPHGSVCVDRQVETVTIPGADGEYGVTAGHSPIVSEMKPGVVQVFESNSGEPERYFVSGGYALTHPDSVTDIAAVEAVKIDDIDPELARKGVSDFKTAMDTAQPNSPEYAKAQIQYEVHVAMCYALGIAV